MTSLKDLLAQRAALEEQIRETQQAEKSGAIAKIRALMTEHGLNLQDIGPAKARTPSAVRTPVAPKYRDNDTGDTWSGRGLQPKWLKAKLASGASLESFRI